MRAAALLAITAVVALGACIDDVDPVWQLDHDRIVAVRVTPPHVPAGSMAFIEGLVAHRGAPTAVEEPMFVTATDPASGLSPTLGQSGGAWWVTAPAEADLERARAAMGLAPDDPVPFLLSVAFPDSGGHRLLATKLVYFGDAEDNPALPTLTIGGAPPSGDDLAVPPDTDVPLVIYAGAMDKVSWLSSCGTLHDDTEPTAILHVQPQDPQRGQLAVVVRNPDGGVVWQVWNLHAP